MAVQVNKKVTASIIAAALSIAMAMAQVWEGHRNHAYQDIGDVWTICYGHAHNVKPGDVATDAQCDAYLQADMSSALHQVLTCIHVPLKTNELAAFTDATFNIGNKIVCGSTLQRKANAGDMTGACQELTKWDYAAGKKVEGLEHRRQAEMKLCLGESA